MPEIQTLGFEERLGLLLDRELSTRANRRLKTPLKQAKLREQAAIEDLDYRAHRGLDKALMSRLATGQCAQRTFDRLQADVAALKARHAAIRQANAALLPATLERLFAGSA